MANELQNTSLSPQRIREKVLAVTGELRSRVASMPSRQRTTLLASVFALVALCVGFAWWIGRTEWRPLFQGLEGRDLQQVEQQLGAAGIAYQPTPDGAGIEVAAEQLDKARMVVATKGMPGSGRMGFELFDKPNWVGSEFDEKVNYQRALEGELEHTIETLGAVRSARVHLTLSRQSLFAAEEHPATASVVLKMRNGSLAREQAGSIRALVAGAVENLHPEQVSLVDADGRFDLNGPTQRAEVQEQEQALERKLVAMLEPLAGTGNVRATVNLSFDPDAEERTDEVYDPQQSAPVSMQRSEQSSTQAARTGSVAGAAANMPGPGPAPPTPALLATQEKNPANLPVYPQAGGPSQAVREESSSYAVTRHLVHTQRSPGRVQRIVAAVVVNDRAVEEKSGKSLVAWKQRTPEEMRRLEQLVQAAVGFDPRRSDQVVVENIAFSENASSGKLNWFERQAENLSGFLRTQPALIRTTGLVLCGALVCFFVLRPLSRQVSEALQPLLPAPNPTAELSIPVLPEPGQVSHAEVQNAFEAVRNQIRTDPQQSARLLESWIGSGKGD
jgi:flagellar M-ring protein FliF